MSASLLILGGTTEATALAQAVADAGINAVFSYAGRVANPRKQPLPTRVGGFGGASGLAAWLRDKSISHVIDATHPFAQQMSRNAKAACAETGVHLAALTRPEWVAGPGDDWVRVPDIAAAVAGLPKNPERIFLALGRMHLADFAAQPQHHYLLRLVDRPEAAPLPNCCITVDRGPFTTAGDIALLQRHDIRLVVSKNAGGSGARAKIDAARSLGLSVVMIDRPELPDRATFATPAQVLDWLDHAGTDRGV